MPPFIYDDFYIDKFNKDDEYRSINASAYPFEDGLTVISCDRSKGAFARISMLKFEISRSDEFHGMILMKSDCTANEDALNPTAYRAVLRAIGNVDNEALWKFIRPHLSETFHFGDTDGDKQVTIKDAEMLGDSESIPRIEDIKSEGHAVSDALVKEARELVKSIKCQEWARYFALLNIRDHPADLMVEAAIKSPSVDSVAGAKLG